MIIRNPWSAAVSPYYGATGLGQVTTDPSALYRELHATAIALNQARQRLEQATNSSQKAAELTNIANLKAHFAHIRERFLVHGAEQDPDGLSKTDKVILTAGTVLEGAPYATGQALLGMTMPLADALGALIGHVGMRAGTALLPWGLIAVGIVGLLLFAEKSRIVRKAVARV